MTPTEPPSDEHRVRAKPKRFKRRTRYRSPQAFDLTTTALWLAVHSPAAERGATR